MAKFKLIPTNDIFFDLFESSAQNIVRAAKCLQTLVSDWGSIDTRVGELTQIEHQGDTITHEIMKELNRSFITPFDREDIGTLAHSLDDITDLIHATADTMLLYKVKAPERHVKEMADTLVQITIEVEKAVPHLRKHSSNLEKILAHCVEINSLENVVDRIYRSALAELFDERSDLAEVIKWREIYEYMEKATDMCEDVANILEGVALKHA